MALLLQNKPQGQIVNCYDSERYISDLIKARNKEEFF